MTKSNTLIRNVGITLASFILITACGKKEVDIPREVLTPNNSNNNNNNNTAPTNTGPITPRIIPGSQEDFLSQISSDTVYFETDRFNIDAQDQSTLRSQAQWLVQYPNTNIRVEGHADERGTRDYNLALGERRANSAKNYLISLGISSNRISTVSFGKERPKALGSDANAWDENRRAVTATVQ